VEMGECRRLTDADPGDAAVVDGVNLPPFTGQTRPTKVGGGCSDGWKQEATVCVYGGIPSGLG